MFVFISWPVASAGPREAALTRRRPKDDQSILDPQRRQDRAGLDTPPPWGLTLAPRPGGDMVLVPGVHRARPRRG